MSMVMRRLAGAAQAFLDTLATADSGPRAGESFVASLLPRFAKRRHPQVVNEASLSDLKATGQLDDFVHSGGFLVYMGERQAARGYDFDTYSVWKVDGDRIVCVAEDEIAQGFEEEPVSVG